MNESPLIATITVLHQGPSGVTAIVNGKCQSFPDREALFRTAIQLLDDKEQPHVRPDPTLRREGIRSPQPLPGLA